MLATFFENLLQNRPLCIPWCQKKFPHCLEQKNRRTPTKIIVPTNEKIAKWVWKDKCHWGLVKLICIKNQ